MKIGIDIMGGDFAPNAVIKGIALSLKELPNDTQLVLFGQKGIIVDMLNSNKINPELFEIENCNQEIEMGENPLKAFTSKKDSGIVKGFSFLAEKKIQAFASAGNTGAMMVGVMSIIKTSKGIIRPCLAIQIPRKNGNPGIILDVGLNPDAKPEVLFQYGIMGSIYAKNVYNIENPKVALMNIGEESVKGNLASKAAYKLMTNNKIYNFVGNIEGTDIFNNEKYDVVVCDGFTGNIILKTAEAFYNAIIDRNINDEYFNKFNFENFGGTPILGINSNVIIAHGHSTPEAIKNMIIKTREIVKAKLPEKIIEIFNHE